jgi:ATP-dependent RNA helicase DDX6/DHH1
VARAKNGTGKTAAYAIPLIQKINVDLKKIQALVLVPTRELAMQTSLVIKNLSKHLKIECMVSTGGTLVREDFYRLTQTVHVIVATPGRILDLASKKVANLDDCNLLVLDEVDKLLSMDFKVNIENILAVMNNDR